MNAGKSTVLNLLTQQSTSIVDSKPGTTADTRTTLMEMHGLGPVRLYDTAGIDEPGELGAKKRRQALADLKECDLILLVIDPASGDFEPEGTLVDAAREHDKQLLVVYNLFGPDEAKINAVEDSLPLLRFYRKISLKADDSASRDPLMSFILRHYEREREDAELLPFAQADRYYPLIVVADAETPPDRLLRPQTMAIAALARAGAWPVCHQIDLAKAREGDTAEAQRFDDLMRRLRPRMGAVITDSQAMDVVNRWVVPEIRLTTFSIMMVNFTSGGRLPKFVAGVEALARLAPGDKILIAEACNHSRVSEDIGTVQIPAIIAKKWPGVVVEHNFGRQFQENSQLRSYKLVIHCGGCMISAQKLQARMRDLDAVGVPYSNYGVFLSYAQGAVALRRALEPWTGAAQQPS